MKKRREVSERRARGEREDERRASVVRSRLWCHSSVRRDSTIRRDDAAREETPPRLNSTSPRDIPSSSSSSPSRRVVASPAAGRVPTDGGAFQRVSRVFGAHRAASPASASLAAAASSGVILDATSSAAATTAVVSAVGAANAPVLANPTIVAARSAAFGPTIGPFFASRAAARDERASRVGVFDVGVGVSARDRGGDGRGGDAVGFAATRVTAAPRARRSRRAWASPPRRRARPAPRRRLGDDTNARTRRSRRRRRRAWRRRRCDFEARVAPSADATLAAS